MSTQSNTNVGLRDCLFAVLVFSSCWEFRVAYHRGIRFFGVLALTGNFGKWPLPPFCSASRNIASQTGIADNFPPSRPGCQQHIPTGCGGPGRSSLRLAFAPDPLGRTVGEPPLFCRIGFVSNNDAQFPLFTHCLLSKVGHFKGWRRLEGILHLQQRLASMRTTPHPLICDLVEFEADPLLYTPSCA